MKQKTIVLVLCCFAPWPIPRAAFNAQSNQVEEAEYYYSKCTTSKRYHKALSLMGATRPASG